MNPDLFDEINKLDAATRLKLAQDLLDSVSSEAFTAPVTDEQRAGLRARLSYHRANPDEASVSRADIKTKPGIS